MNLVNEEHRAVAVTLFGLRFLNRLAQVLDAGEDGRERDKAHAALFGQQPGERRFAGAGCAPENQRRQRAAAGQQLAQDASLTYEVVLSDEFGERAWPHALG